eukprot:g25802.t1
MPLQVLLPHAACSLIKYCGGDEKTANKWRSFLDHFNVKRSNDILKCKCNTAQGQLMKINLEKNEYLEKNECQILRSFVTRQSSGAPSPTASSASSSFNQHHRWTLPCW